MRERGGTVEADGGAELGALVELGSLSTKVMTGGEECEAVHSYGSAAIQLHRDWYSMVTGAVVLE